jgi:tRNA nucleotidyltransferase/poly(A) polymerase
MDSEDVFITLNRINSELDRIFKARGWLRILEATQEPMALETTLGCAMYHAQDLKLRVNRILEQQKYQEQTRESFRSRK